MRRLVQSLLSLCLSAGPVTALAADVAHGQQLYQQYCAVCHGPNPGASQPVGVAYDPEGLRLAILKQQQMMYLDDLLSDEDLTDITEYIGSVVAPRNVTPQTGWYWNPAESGRGFFIEQHGSNVFMAGFHYEADGRATWFTGQGAAASSKLFAPMSIFGEGQTLTGPYQSPKSLTSPGTVGLTFTTTSTTAMTWPGGSIALVRFPFSGGSSVEAAQAGAPESGWWWNATEPGRGFAIEFQGSSIFICGFMYDAAGNPIWYLSTGPMSAPNRYDGAWMQFANGQAMGAPYRAPTVVDSNVGALTLEFSDSRNGTLTLPDGRRIGLTRFAF